MSGDPLLDEAAERAMTPEQREKHERGKLRQQFSPYGEL